MLNVSVRDEFPTPRFPEVDAKIIELHQSYRAHVGAMPAPAQPVPAVSDAESEKVAEDPVVEFSGASFDVPSTSGKEPIEQSKALAELETRIDALQRQKVELMNQVAEVRGAIGLLRMPMLVKQWLLMAGIGVLGLWLGFGIGIIGVRMFGQPAWSWPLVGLLSAAGLTALILRTAQTTQLALEISKDSVKIPYLAHLADCYKKLVLKASPDEALPPEQQEILARRLEKWKQERHEGLEMDEARAQKRLMYVFLGIAVGFLFLSSVYSYGMVPFQRIFESALIFGLPAAMVFAFVFWLAPVSLRMPILGETQEELTKIANEIRRAELENRLLQKQIEKEDKERVEQATKVADLRRQEDRQKAEQRHAEARVNAAKQAELARQDQLKMKGAETEYQQRLKAWATECSALIERLKKMASEWEFERGFTMHERAMIAAQLKEAKSLAAFYSVLSFVSIVILTYFASVTLNEILTLSYLYPNGNVSLKIAPISWVLWIAVIFLTEKFALVPSLSKLTTIRSKENVLQHGFDVTTRVKGHRYLIMGPEEAAKARKTPMFALVFGLVVLAIELACNVMYLVSYSFVDGILGYLVAFLPFAFFVLLMFPLAETDEKVSRLKEALLTPERPSQAGRGPNATTHREAATLSDQAYKEWERMGPRL